MTDGELTATAAAILMYMGYMQKQVLKGQTGEGIDLEMQSTGSVLRKLLANAS